METKIVIYRVSQPRRKFPKTVRGFRLFAGVVLALAVFGSALFVAPQPAKAAVLTWDGGCGANTNWSCANNWSTDSVPAAGDTVTFDNTSDNNSTVDALFNATETIVTININSGYDGTITLATTLHVTTSFVQGAGTFTAANQTLDLNGSFSLTGGSFTASSGSTTLAGAMTISGSPTFNHNGGVITLDSGTSATLACNNVTFNSVVIGSSGGTKTVGSTCNLPLGANPTITNSVILNGTLSGSGTLSASAGTLTLNSGFSLSGFSGVNLNTLTISGATANFGSYTTFTVGGAFTLSSGANFTAPSGVMSVGSGFTLNSGTTFAANSGTLTFTGASPATLACNNTTFNLVTFTNSGTKTVGSDCIFPLGSNPNVGSMTLNGTLSGSGTLTVANGTLTLNSGFALSGFSGLSAPGFTVSGATFNASSYSPFDVTGAFTLSSGAVFTAPSGTMRVGGNFTLNSGTTFNHGGGTLQIQRTSSPNFGSNSATLACNNTTFNSVIILLSSVGTRTVNSDCNLPLGADPFTYSGTAAGTILLSGTLSGTGTLSTSNLTLNSGSSLSGFSGLMVSNTMTVSGATVDFGAYTFLQAGTSNFTLSSGANFTAPTGTMNAGGMNFNAGTTFNHNGGVLDFNRGGSVICTSNPTFNSVVFSNTTGAISVGAGCVFPVGANPTIASGSGGLTMNGGMLTGSGTITLPTSGTLSLAGSFDAQAHFSGFTGLVAGIVSISSGATANFGNYTTFDINGAFTSTGNITAPAGNASFASTFSIGSTFNANGGTIIFDGAASASLTCNNVTFNLVAFAQTQGTKTVGSTCSLPLGNNPVIGNSGGIGTGADIILNGVLSGTGTLTFGPVGSQVDDLTINNSGSSGISGFTGIVMNGSFTNAGATLDFSSYSPATFNRHFTLNSGGVFTAPVGLMTVSRDLALSAGTTFSANGGILTFDGDNGGTLACNSTTFAQVNFTHTSGRKTVNNDCSFPLGNNPNAGAGGAITLNGTLSGTGTITTTGGLILNAGYVLSGFTGLNADVLTIDAATANFGSYNTFDVDSDFILNNNANFTATSATSTIGGDFQVNSGSTFNHNNGAVILDGGDQVITGATTFNDLSKTIASVESLTFPAGLTQTVLGDLVLKGADGQLLSLLSSDPGNQQWSIDAQGSRDLRYLSVADSNNINATAMEAFDSTNGGGNTNWNFPNTPLPPPSGGSGGSSSSSGGGNENSGGALSYTVGPTVEETEATEEPKPETTEPEAEEDRFDGGDSAIENDLDESDPELSFIWPALGGFVFILLLGFLIFILLRRRSSE